VSSPIWGSWPDIYYCLTITVLILWGALSDDRTVLSFSVASGPRQRSHSRVRVPWDSWLYFTVSDSKLPFSSPPTTRRASVEVFDPASTRDCSELIYDSCYITSGETDRKHLTFHIQENVCLSHISTETSLFFFKNPSLRKRVCHLVLYQWVCMYKNPGIPSNVRQKPLEFILLCVYTYIFVYLCIIVVSFNERKSHCITQIKRNISFFVMIIKVIMSEWSWNEIICSVTGMLSPTAISWFYVLVYEGTLCVLEKQKC
jgi:hypothetical protein